MSERKVNLKANENIMTTLQKEEGKYYLIFCSDWGGFSTVKCVGVTMSGELGFQIHETRIILNESEIDEFIKEVEKPKFGKEYE